MELQSEGNGYQRIGSHSSRETSRHQDNDGIDVQQNDKVGGGEEGEGVLQTGDGGAMRSLQGNHDVNDETKDEPGEGNGLSELSCPMMCSFILMLLVELAIQAFVSILGPFFPQNAEEKGVSASHVGLVFGIVPLVSLIASPFFGSFASKIGIKFLLVSGVLSAGYCSILFGFTDWAEDPGVYLGLCLAVRALEGVATAAACTAVFAILAHSCPTRLATASGLLEVTAGLGFIIGAPIGGVLYECGGFLAPFLASGVFMMAIGLVICVTTPSVKGDELVCCESHWSLLLRPRVAVALVTMVAGISFLGVYITRTGVHIADKLHYGPMVIGSVYFSAAVAYLVGSLVWGALAEHWVRYSALLFSGGYMAAAVPILFLGPAPFLGLQPALWVIYVASTLVGFGMAAGLIAFQITGLEAREKYGDSWDTSGWVGGVLNTCVSLGEFLGQVTAGYLDDGIGYEWTCAGGAFLLFGLASLQLTIHFLQYCWRCNKSREDERLLLTQRVHPQKGNCMEER